jgi:hypothetical protein
MQPTHPEPGAGSPVNTQSGADEPTASVTGDDAAAAGSDSDRLIHFTHEIDGHLYAGWYHRLPGSRIEVFTRTRRATATLGKPSIEEEARRLLEELVRRDRSTEMLSREDAKAPPPKDP